SADADVLAMFISGKPVGGSISGTWSRMIQPTVLGNPDLSYNNDTITGTADLRLQPGMGTLDWHFGYQFTGIFFEDSQSTVYNNLLHTVYTRGRWRFRPRTALVYEGSIGSHTFPKADGAIFSLHTQMPIRTAIGIDGLVTSRVSLLAMVGYSGLFASRGNGNDPSVQQYDSVTGNAEIRFFPTRTIVEGMENQGTAVLPSNIALGYQRVMQ